MQHLIARYAPSTCSLAQHEHVAHYAVHLCNLLLRQLFHVCRSTWYTGAAHDFVVGAWQVYKPNMSCRDDVELHTEEHSAIIGYTQRLPRTAEATQALIASFQEPLVRVSHERRELSQSRQIVYWSFIRLRLKTGIEVGYSLTNSHPNCAGR
jgi:hypothetical protein